MTKRALNSHLTAYPSVPALVIASFCIYIALWYLHVSSRVEALATVRFELLAPSLLLAVAVLRGLSLGSPLTPYILTFAVCLVIQIPLSVAPGLSWNVMIDRVLKYAAIAVLIASFVKGPSQLRWFMAAFLLAMTKLLQEGVFGVVTGSLMWENQGVMRLHGPTRMYGHPNSFAGMALGTLPFVVYLAFAVRRVQRVLLFAIGVAACVVVLYTGSRTAYVAVVGFLAVIVLKSQYRVRSLIVVIAIAIAFVSFAPPEYLERFDSIRTQEDKEGASVALRREILADAIQVFAENPFGVGIGAFPVVRKARFGREQDTHNLYLEVATNLGIQGLAAFAFLIGALLYYLHRLTADFDDQRRVLANIVPSTKEEPNVRAHMADLLFMRQVAHAIQAFVVLRLFLGMFGMDLYEIYWSFAIGIFIALFQMCQVANARTTHLAHASQPQVAGLSTSVEARPTVARIGRPVRPVRQNVSR